MAKLRGNVHHFSHLFTMYRRRRGRGWWNTSSGFVSHKQFWQFLLYSSFHFEVSVFFTQTSLLQKKQLEPQCCETKLRPIKKKQQQQQNKSLKQRGKYSSKKRKGSFIDKLEQNSLIFHSYPGDFHKSCFQKRKVFLTLLKMYWITY